MPNRISELAEHRREERARTVLAGLVPGRIGRCTTARGSRHSHPCQLTSLGLPSLQARGKCEIAFLHDSSVLAAEILPCFAYKECSHYQVFNISAYSGQMVMGPSLGQRTMDRAAKCMRMVQRDHLQLRMARMGAAQAELQRAEVLSSFQVRP